MHLILTSPCVRIAECCLSNGAEFHLATTVDLRPRNDTGSINNPPVPTTPPLVYAVEGCSSTLQLSVADRDQDEVRCREMESSECGRGGCVPLPSWITLDSSCTIAFNNASRGEFYVSLVVEDFPVGSNMSLSTVPLSFTVSPQPQPAVISCLCSAPLCVIYQEFCSINCILLFTEIVVIFTDMFCNQQ